MTGKIQNQTLYAYHFDTILRLVNCALKLNEADYHDNPGYGHGSVHELLFHLLVTDLRWRVGMSTGQRMPVIQADNYPGLPEIQSFCATERQAWMDYLGDMSEEEIGGDARMVASNGEVGFIPRWRILTHVILHGMQHGAELAELLTLKGQSPGNIDFIFYE